MYERELRGRQRPVGDRLSDQIAIGLRRGFRCGRRVRRQPASANAARAVAGSRPVSAHIAPGDGDATSSQLPRLSAIRAADVGITAHAGYIR
jgi:hypothetical protein